MTKKKPITGKTRYIAGRAIKEELRKTKEDLESLEVYIKSFSSFLPLAICTVNPLRIIIDVNQAFQKLTHYIAVEIIGEPLEKIFLEKKELEGLLEEVQKKEKIRTKELTLLSKERKETPVSLSVSIRKDEKGNLIGYFLAVFDITEIKKFREELEDKVKKRTKELQEKVEELENFHKLAVGRELKMIALKEEIEKLKKKKNRSTLKKD